MTATQPKRIPVTAETSTVLGYPGKKFWHHLQWDKGVRKDNSFGCVYLHVAACHRDDKWETERSWYRVRPVKEAGCVGAEQQADGSWCWVYEGAAGGAPGEPQTSKGNAG